MVWVFVIIKDGVHSYKSSKYNTYYGILTMKIYVFQWSTIFHNFMYLIPFVKVDTLNVNKLHTGNIYVLSRIKELFPKGLNDIQIKRHRVVDCVTNCNMSWPLNVFEYLETKFLFLSFCYIHNSYPLYSFSFRRECLGTE